MLFDNVDGDVEIDEFKSSPRNPLRARPKSRRDRARDPPPRRAEPQRRPVALRTAGAAVRVDRRRRASDRRSASTRATWRTCSASCCGSTRAGREAQPYGIPPDNPLVGEPGRDEIFAYGFRNPWRFSFDGRRLAIADVGQRRFEEVNFLSISKALGANFGWPQYEGNELFAVNRPGADPPTFPVLTYTHDFGCAVAGGYVMHDPGLPALEGRYIYTDFCSGELRTLPAPGRAGRRVHGGRRQPLGLTIVRPTSFGVDAEGQIYVTQATGPVTRLEPSE